MIVITKTGTLNKQLETARDTIAAALAAAPRGDIKMHGLRFWARHGSRFELADKSAGVREILRFFGIDWTEENESPRGGAAGYVLVIPTAERRKLRKALEKMAA